MVPPPLFKPRAAYRLFFRITTERLRGRARDNFIGMVTSMMLTSIIFLFVVIKLEDLVRLPEVKAILTERLKEIYSVPMLGLTVALLVAALGVLAFGLFLLGEQTLDERQQAQEKALLARSKRMRYAGTNTMVEAPPIEDDEYHLFLSQCVLKANSRLHVALP